MRRTLLISLLAALATAALGVAPAGAKVTLVDAEGNLLKKGSVVHATSNDFKIWTGGHSTLCETVPLTGILQNGPTGDHQLGGTEGSGKNCALCVPGWGCWKTEVHSLSLGTVKFLGKGAGTLSLVKLHATFTFYGGLTCTWTGGPASSTWWGEGGSQFGGGGFSFVQELTSPEEECYELTVEGSFHLSLPSGAPVYIKES